MKNGRITIIFLVLLCCSLVLTGCKDTVEENTAAEAIEVKAAAEATAVAEKAVAEAEKAQVVVTKTNLVVLHNALLQFKMDTGRYPEEAEGLNALIEKPVDISGWCPGGYLDITELPKDGWGREFIYRFEPETGKPFVIISLGADGEEGGEGVDVDYWYSRR